MHTDQDAFTLPLAHLLIIQVLEWINTAVSGQGVLIWGPADWFHWENRCVRNGQTIWNCSSHSHPKQLFGREGYTLFILEFALLPKWSLFRVWVCEPGCWMSRAVSWRGVWGGKLWKIDEGEGRKQSSPGGCSGHQNHTHGVGVTGTWTPAGQHDDNVSLFEEASGLAWKLNRKNI